METFNQIKTRLSKLTDEQLYSEWKSCFGDIPYNRTRNQSIYDISHYKQELKDNAPAYEEDEPHRKIESLIPEMLSVLVKNEKLLRGAYHLGMLTNEGHTIWNETKAIIEKAK